MVRMTFWALRNKINKKWFYEEFRFTLQDCESWKVETDSISDLTISNRRFYLDDEIATKQCKKFSDKYDLDLEVVKIEEIVEYKEVE
ncbi:MAG: hypothetical protein ACRCX2_19985 [Paraclostridium sp.]